MVEALFFLKEGKLSLFDGLVGENSCQIRAAMILDLYIQKDSNEIMECVNQLVYIQQELKDLDLPNLIKSNISLMEILEENQLKLFFPKSIIATALSYLLTITKSSKLEFTRNIETGHVLTTLCEDTHQKSLNNTRPNLSLKSANTLDKTARKMLSELSIRYIQEKAAFHKELENLVSDEFIKQDHKK